MQDRRSFFRSLIPSVEEKQEREPAVVRPPYVTDFSLFRSHCPECADTPCVSACEEEIVLIRADRTPMLNFTKGGCTFCDACAEACPEGVLGPEGPERINARFVIETEGCLAHHSTICFACREPCLDDAILFNGMFNPVIDESRCTGCGFCLSRCPTRAIRYEAL
ncbi:ferredoxin-type protein NapF [Nitratifractor sp.]